MDYSTKTPVSPETGVRHTCANPAGLAEYAYLDDPNKMVVQSTARDDADADCLTIIVGLKNGVKREDCSVITIERVVAKWLADALSERGWVEYRLGKQSFKLRDSEVTQ